MSTEYIFINITVSKETREGTISICKLYVLLLEWNNLLQMKWNILISNFYVQAIFAIKYILKPQLFQGIYFNDITQVLLTERCEHTTVCIVVQAIYIVWSSECVLQIV